VYKAPIMIAGSLFVLGTVVEIIAIELWRGPLVEWLTQPQKLPVLLVMIGIKPCKALCSGTPPIGLLATGRSCDGRSRNTTS